MIVPNIILGFVSLIVISCLASLLVVCLGRKGCFKKLREEIKEKIFKKQKRSTM
ncbi:MAG: hypothetical protein ABIH51_00200 [Patescibacteria group bacterium]